MYRLSKANNPEMARKDMDMMPRSLVMSMMIGCLIGGSFWATLATILVS
jgi:hypothetical protein